MPAKGSAKQQDLTPVQKGIAAFVGLLILVLCLTIANKAQSKSQRNASDRLMHTKARHEACERDRKRLLGDKFYQGDELKIAEDEYQALKSENALLKEDNEEMAADIAELEKFVDDLREEFDDKDFISDDEAEQLEETLALGNNSKELSGLLHTLQVFDKSGSNEGGIIGKDELVNALLAELKKKTRALLGCMAEKKVIGKIDPGFMWDELSKDQQRAMLKAAVKRIASAQLNDFMEAESMMKTWGSRHPFGVEGLKDDVTKRRDEKEQARAAKEKELGGVGDDKIGDVHGLDRDEDEWFDWNEEEDVFDGANF